MARNALLLAGIATFTLFATGCSDGATASSGDAVPAPAAEVAPATPAAGSAPAAPAAAAAGDDDTMHHRHRLEIKDIYVIAGTESGRPVTPEECRDGCKDHATCISWKFSESILGAGNPGNCTWWATVGKPVPTGEARDYAGVIASKAK